MRNVKKVARKVSRAFQPDTHNSSTFTDTALIIIAASRCGAKQSRHYTDLVSNFVTLQAGILIQRKGNELSSFQKVSYKGITLELFNRKLKLISFLIKFFIPLLTVHHIFLLRMWRQLFTLHISTSSLISFAWLVGLTWKFFRETLSISGVLLSRKSHSLLMNARVSSIGRRRRA